VRALPESAAAYSCRPGREPHALVSCRGKNQRMVTVQRNMDATSGFYNSGFDQLLTGASATLLGMAL
jgi:hypothetical protein